MVPIWRNTIPASLLYTIAPIWHSVYMSNNLNKAKAKMGNLRCAIPPYYLVARSADGEPVVAMPGDTFGMLERGYAPSALECAQLLIRFRRTTRWSRPAMAAFMGVSPQVLRRWETGERKMSGAARRLTWLLELLVNDPDQFIDALSMVFWGTKNMADALKCKEQMERQSLADYINAEVSQSKPMAT
jgi:transcriptional regulator with XRE-family HTH domain